MPIYEFECADCRERFDRLQKISDPDPAACPKCGAAAVRRRVTAPAFRLAGSGWYETDFKKGAEKKRNLADKDAAEKPAAKTGDSKPAGGDGAASKPAETKASKPAVATEN